MISQELSETEQGSGGIDEKELNLFMVNGLSMIHKNNNASQILQTVNQSRSRGEAIGNIVAPVIERLESSAGEEGVEISPETTLSGMVLLIEEVASIIEETGGEPITEEELKEATGTVVGVYLEDAISSGKITKEQVIELAVQLEESPEIHKTLEQLQVQGKDNQVYRKDEKQEEPVEAIGPMPMGGGR